MLVTERTASIMTIETTHGWRMRPGLRKHLLLGLLLVLASLVAGLIPGSQAHASDVPGFVTVDTMDGLPWVDGGQELTGINVPVYNNHFLDAGIATTFNANQIAHINPHGANPPLMTSSVNHGTGTDLFRYPGGGTADVYHWTANSVGPIDPSTKQPLLLSYADPAMNFDAFMKQVAAMGADEHTEATIVVNYGSSDSQDAANWVSYANKNMTGYVPDSTHSRPKYSGASTSGHNYGIRFWEIGNELYGDGTYTN